MKKQTLIIGLLSGLLGFCGCHSKTTDKTSQTQTKSQEMTITVETMKQVLDAFNRHDLDAIMEFFSDDCSLYFPRGPEPWGQRYTPNAGVGVFHQPHCCKKSSYVRRTKAAATINGN